MRYRVIIGAVCAISCFNQRCYNKARVCLFLAVVHHIRCLKHLRANTFARQQTNIKAPAEKNTENKWSVPGNKGQYTLISLRGNDYVDVNTLTCIIKKLCFLAMLLISNVFINKSKC